MMPVVEVLKTIQELVCSYFSEEQFTLSSKVSCNDIASNMWYTLGYGQA